MDKITKIKKMIDYNLSKINYKNMSFYKYNIRGKGKVDSSMVMKNYKLNINGMEFNVDICWDMCEDVVYSDVYLKEHKNMNFIESILFNFDKMILSEMFDETIREKPQTLKINNDFYQDYILMTNIAEGMGKIFNSLHDDKLTDEENEKLEDDIFFYLKDKIKENIKNA